MSIRRIGDLCMAMEFWNDLMLKRYGSGRFFFQHFAAHLGIRGGGFLWALYTLCHIS
jgi:hypothetical protein